MTYLLQPYNTDLFNVNNIVQATSIVAGKNLLIDTLRDVFREDREFKFVSDVFGFPLVKSEVGLSSDAGLNDDETTRIFIGSVYRFDAKFFPAISIKNTGTRYVPISFNQDYLGIKYRQELLQDGYGRSTVISTPAYHTLVGAWDQTFELKVTSESAVDREELCDIVQTILMSTRRLELQNAGLFIKNLSTSGESEESYGNGYLYSISINLETRTEFKVLIPISNVVERIGFFVTFAFNDKEDDALVVNEVTTQADLL